MALEVTIRAKMVEALKAGDKDTKMVYTAILTALTNKDKELQAELTPEQDIEVITKLSKQNQESIDTCPADRTDTIEKLKFERAIITQYMPKQMDENEVRQVIQEVLNKLGMNTFDIKAKGKVMKELMPLVKGKADGKLVNKVLESM